MKEFMLDIKLNTDFIVTVETVYGKRCVFEACLVLMQIVSWMFFTVSDAFCRAGGVLQRRAVIPLVVVVASAWRECRAMPATQSPAAFLLR